jgi:hypothetical protein
MAGDYIVVGCKGRVWAISRALPPTFRSFMRSARKAELEQGASPKVKIIADEGRAELSFVEFTWDLGDRSMRLQ